MLNTEPPTKVAVFDRPLDHRATLLRGVGIILLGSLLFGTMAVCVQLAAREMPPSQIAFTRFAGSLCILLGLRGRRSLRPHSGNWLGIGLRGLLGACAILLYYRGIEGAGAGFATLLHCTYPVSTALFSSTLMGEHFDARLGVALALSLLGVFVIFGPGADLSSATMLGGFSALGASVLAGGAVTTARYLRLSESAFLVTTYFMAIGSLCTAPALLVGFPEPSLSLILALLGVVLTSVGGQVLLHQGLGLAPATLASLAAATSVVSAAVLQALWIGEYLTYHTMAGACLLILAVSLAVPPRS